MRLTRLAELKLRENALDGVCVAASSTCERFRDPGAQQATKMTF